MIGLLEDLDRKGALVQELVVVAGAVVYCVELVDDEGCAGWCQGTRDPFEDEVFDGGVDLVDLCDLVELRYWCGGRG